ncbi:hypothetical protein ACQ4PT_021435 [Festuca glaucescens]
MEKKNAPAVVAPEAVASEPVASEPIASEPVASEPVASEPVAAEPVASEPIAAEPVASEGGASKRGASVNWASLMADGPLHKIGECLLANEEYVDTYSALRQVCRNWRSGLPEPDVHLHECIMVEHALPRAAEFTFLQLGTSRYVTIDLTEVHARTQNVKHITAVTHLSYTIVCTCITGLFAIVTFVGPYVKQQWQADTVDEVFAKIEKMEMKRKDGEKKHSKEGKTAKAVEDESPMKKTEQQVVKTVKDHNDGASSHESPKKRWWFF